MQNAYLITSAYEYACEGHKNNYILFYIFVFNSLQTITGNYQNNVLSLQKPYCKINLVSIAY